MFLFLAKTLPDDQDKMVAELASYAESKKQKKENNSNLPLTFSEQYKELGSSIFDDSQRFQRLDDNMTQTGEESIVSIEDRMSSFDVAAARESWTFIEDALREMRQLSTVNRENFDVIDEIYDAPMDDEEMDGEAKRLLN